MQAPVHVAAGGVVFLVPVTDAMRSDARQRTGIRQEWVIDDYLVVQALLQIQFPLRGQLLGTFEWRRFSPTEWVIYQDLGEEGHEPV